MNKLELRQNSDRENHGNGTKDDNDIKPSNRGRREGLLEEDEDHLMALSMEGRVKVDPGSVLSEAEPRSRRPTMTLKAWRTMEPQASSLHEPQLSLGGAPLYSLELH